MTAKKRPLRIAGQLVGPFTTGWGVARPAVPTGSGGLREARLIGRQGERVDEVVHALEDFHAGLEPLALIADLLEREERGDGRGRSVRDDLRHPDLVGRPLAFFVAGNGHQPDDFAAVDERHEESRREVLMLAAIRCLVVGLIVDRDGPLLANRTAPRRVLRERRVGVELLDRAVRPHGETVGELGLRSEEVEAVHGERVLGRLVYDADELVQLVHARKSDRGVPGYRELRVLGRELLGTLAKREARLLDRARDERGHRDHR